MAFEIGTASAADVMLMAEWAAAENWNPGLTDARAFVVADPRGFLIGRMDGEPVTCISVVRYGEAFGFLGMYIARSDACGRGLGHRTWQAGMARLTGRTVALDGVVAQQDNYRRSGFHLAWTSSHRRGYGSSMPATSPSISSQPTTAGSSARRATRSSLHGSACPPAARVSPFAMATS